MICRSVCRVPAIRWCSTTARVLPARLYGHRGTPPAAQWSCCCWRTRGTESGNALPDRAGELKPRGRGIPLEIGELHRYHQLQDLQEGKKLVQFHYEGIFLEILERLGKMPLPPSMSGRATKRRAVSDRVFQGHRFCCGTYSGASVYQRTASKNSGHGCQHCLCNTACGAGHALGLFRRRRSPTTICIAESCVIY